MLRNIVEDTGEYSGNYKSRTDKTIVTQKMGHHKYKQIHNTKNNYNLNNKNPTKNRM